LLLSETVVVMHWNVGNCTTKRANINIARQIKFCHVLYQLGIWKNCHAVPALYVHRFSRYTISVLHNLVKVIPSATVWTRHLRTVQYKSSQQSAIQPDTTHWTWVCSVLWLQRATGKVQA